MEKFKKKQLKAIETYLEQVCQNNEKCQNCDCYNPQLKHCLLAFYCVANNFRGYQNLTKRSDKNDYLGSRNIW